MEKEKVLQEQVVLGNILKNIKENKPITGIQLDYIGIKLNILQWNSERNNFGFNYDNEIKMLEEEADEAEEADHIHDFLDGRCDEYVVMTGTLAKSGMAGIPLSEELNAWYGRYLDIPREIEANGYSFRKCMNETLKEINSRRQDPEQKKRWEESGIPLGEKWQKSKQQDPKTLYKADFSKCKL